MIASALYSSNNSNKADPFNPFSSFVKDMTSSIMGYFLSFQPQVDQALATLVFWEDVRSTLESKMDTNDERLFRNKLAKGYGVASPLHRVRLSDESYAEKDISSGVLPRFGFVVSVLSKSMAHAGKKRIHYRSEKVNMRFVTARNRLNSCA